MSKNINKNQLIAAELLAIGMKSKEVANKYLYHQKQLQMEK